MLNMIKLDWLGMKYYWVRVIIIPLSICFMGGLSLLNIASRRTSPQCFCLYASVCCYMQF